MEECIIFSAALRKHTLPAPQRKARTDEVTKALGLRPVQHNFIANRNGSGGISGGERRRVAVAIELVLLISLLGSIIIYVLHVIIIIIVHVGACSLLYQVICKLHVIRNVVSLIILHPQDVK